MSRRKKIATYAAGIGTLLAAAFAFVTHKRKREASEDE